MKGYSICLFAKEKTALLRPFPYEASKYIAMDGALGGIIQLLVLCFLGHVLILCRCYAFWIDLCEIALHGDGNVALRSVAF